MSLTRVASELDCVLRPSQVYLTLAACLLVVVVGAYADSAYHLGGILSYFGTIGCILGLVATPATPANEVRLTDSSAVASTSCPLSETLPADALEKALSAVQPLALFAVVNRVFFTVLFCVQNIRLSLLVGTAFFKGCSLGPLLQAVADMDSRSAC